MFVFVLAFVLQFILFCDCFVVADVCCISLLVCFVYKDNLYVLCSYYVVMLFYPCCVQRAPLKINFTATEWTPCLNITIALIHLLLYS